MSLRSKRPLRGTFVRSYKNMAILTILILSNFDIVEVREVEVSSVVCIRIAEDINRRFSDRIAYCD